MYMYVEMSSTGLIAFISVLVVFILVIVVMAVAVSFCHKRNHDNKPAARQHQMFPLPRIQHTYTRF